MVAVQNFQKVVFDACDIRDPVKKPCGTILAVNIVFLIGYPASPPRAFGTETLSFILTFDMTMDDVLDRHITLGEWLRDRDYVGINYDYNCDD